MTHPLQLLFLLCLVIPAAKLAGAGANRIGQPAVFGEILAGLLLGPTLLDVLGWPVFQPVATAHGAGEPLLNVMRDLAHIGVILLMFIAGMETDITEMRRVGKVAFWAAAGGVALPLTFGALTASYFGLPMLWQGIFIGTILTATSVSISAQTLLEIGALRSKEGSTILGAAVIDDVMGIILLSVVVALTRATGDLSQVAWIAVRMAVYFIVAIWAGRFLGALVRRTRHLEVSQGVLAIVLAVAFLYAWAAEYVGGVAAITGSYLAGVLFAQTPYKEEIDRGIHPLTYSMLVPVFFVSIGLEANGRELGEHALFAVTLVLVAVVTKALGCGLFARLSGFNNREATRVGLGMISRGEVGLIVAGYGLDNGIISRDVFSASVIMVLVTTMITPPLLRLSFPRGRAASAMVEETIAGPPEEVEG
ncbi:MAG: cation:proton antiporter [Acidobacteria bacterium]|nr:cation:proton antiporter [Acidobacteriota bacterium]